MNDTAKHQNVTGQLNRQTADSSGNAYVFLFFSTTHFLKIILASRTNGAFAFVPTHKANPSQNQKSHFLRTHRKNLTLTN
jgi:hypothetical protein